MPKIIGLSAQTDTNIIDKILIAFGMEKRYQRHLDTHVGLPKELRKVGENEIAEIFEEVDTFRAGRWYGSKGNGEIVKKSLDCLEKVEIWAIER